MTGAQPTDLVYPEPFWRKIIPEAIEAYLLRTVRVDPGGTEANIPADGPLVSVFAPHSGWIESMIIDRCFTRAGRTWPAWLTKRENRALPRVLRGSRVICLDRQNPEPRLVRSIYALLNQPSGALATSIEGTRFGNPQDPEDLLTLGTFKTGPVRFATRAGVPILPVVLLGSERVASGLEQAWPRHGTGSALRQIQGLVAAPQPIRVRFLPIYRDHLRAIGPRVSTRQASARFHTSRLRTIIAAKILELDSSYPIGASDQLEEDN